MTATTRWATTLTVLTLTLAGCATSSPPAAQVTVTTPSPQPHGWWAAITTIEPSSPPVPTSSRPLHTPEPSSPPVPTSSRPLHTPEPSSPPRNSQAPSQAPPVTSSQGPILDIPGDLLFATGSAQLNSQARDSIDKIALELAHASAVVVAGHTDDTDHAHNQQLSDQRAAAVVRAFHDAHLPATVEVTAVGCSDAHPIASNDTPTGRSQNRRVTIITSSTNLTKAQACSADSQPPTAGP